MTNPDDGMVLPVYHNTARKIKAAVQSRAAPWDHNYMRIYAHVATSMQKQAANAVKDIISARKIT